MVLVVVSAAALRTAGHDVERYRLSLQGEASQKRRRLTVTSSVITGNLAQRGSGAAGDTGGIASGGGINNDATFTATITNCFIASNKAVGGAGRAEGNGGLGLGGGISSGNEALPSAVSRIPHRS